MIFLIEHAIERIEDPDAADAACNDLERISKASAADGFHVEVAERTYICSRKQGGAAMKYSIIWGHSGTFGKEWSTAQEASAYAGCEWGEVEAKTAEDAATIAIGEISSVDAGEGRWLSWHDGENAIHVINACEQEAKRWKV